MRVIDGEHTGKKGDIVKGFMGGTLIRVGGKKYNLEKHVVQFKQINISEQRTLGQVVVCLLLGITIIGLPIAILIMIFYKSVNWSAGVETQDGTRFVLQSNSRREYKLAQKWLGKGEAIRF